MSHETLIAELQTRASWFQVDHTEPLVGPYVLLADVESAITAAGPPPSLRAQIEQIEAELLMAKACLHEVATDPEAWIDGCLERCRTLLALYGAPAKIDTSSWDNPVMNASADALKEPKR